MHDRDASFFSVAQSRGGVALRSQIEPRGIANNDLARLKRLKLGNDLLDFTIGVIKRCNDCLVPYVMENPLTSYAWHDCGLKHVLRGAELATCTNARSVLASERPLDWLSATSIRWQTFRG